MRSGKNHSKSAPAAGRKRDAEIRRRLRSDAARIWTAALRAVDAEAGLRRRVRRRGAVLAVDGVSYRLDRPRNIWAIGAGKAAAAMGRALETVLGPYLSGGIVVTKYEHGLPLKKIEVLEAGHPLPDANGAAAGERIRRMAEERVRPGDLVFCLLSGGGSALLVGPARDLTWEDKSAATRLLLSSGATIRQMNAVRKHLSSLKGGGLARLLAPARVVCLILSDVVGDELETIASGPLAADSTTFQDCIEIFRRLGITDGVPAPVMRRLEAGAAGAIPETPKEGDPVFRRIRNVFVGSNGQACTAACREARRLGYHCLVLSSRLEGDTAEAARFHLGVLEEILTEERPLGRPACLVSGGETTVKVTGDGRGGRNQEFVLQCVPALARFEERCLAASIGTDGTDGPTDAAGAVADDRTLERSREFGVDFLETCLARNDSYAFFEHLDDLIVTGPTRTNVMDLHLFLTA